MSWIFALITVEVDEWEDVRNVWVLLTVGILIIDVVLDTELGGRLGDRLGDKLDEVADEERDGVLDDEVDTDTLLTETLDVAEDEVDTSTLRPELLGEVEDEVVAGGLLVELLVAGVVLDMVEVESVDKIKGDEVEETLVTGLEADVVVDVLWAKVEVAIASPQARAAMELLRRFCIVIEGRRSCSEEDSPDSDGEFVQTRD